MTKQEYYDLLVRSARDGTFPSIECGECCYRGANGTKCALGVLIPDELYKESMEGHGPVEDVFNRFLIDYGLIPAGIKRRDLEEIQSLHDSHAMNGWIAQGFIEDLNNQLCFSDVIKEQV